VTEKLEWTRVTDREWWAHVADGELRYVIRNIKGTWRVKMDGAPVGPKEGFVNFASAKEYVDWGGTPNRMGHDRETGEVM
jgi:hypothetical protein